MISSAHLRPRHALALAGAGLVVTSALTGCGAISDLTGGAQRDEDTSEVTESGTESVFDIQVGDCLLGPGEESDEVQSVEVVPCDEPHDYEFYHEYALDLGSAWPGVEEIQADADERCYNAFEDFAGIAYEDSETLYFTYYSPTEMSWAEGDDKIQCLIFQSEDGASITQTEGTLEGFGA
ncbi:septum formation family protein [Microbacterium sp. ZXX196]|uniref:septum formation family protein n=1 Tax=Microbacterium sp. ZXX196 TaxID=2609291 RepID=UPI0012B74F9E|nr:septum formation family protein [Microbacterium sp. ZXX196]MTE23833.1 hypothetical protein [Microbacterium sp. ZXX196]